MRCLASPGTLYVHGQPKAHREAPRITPDEPRARPAPQLIVTRPDSPGNEPRAQQHRRDLPRSDHPRPATCQPPHPQQTTATNACAANVSRLLNRPSGLGAVGWPHQVRGPVGRPGDAAAAPREPAAVCYAASRVANKLSSDHQPAERLARRKTATQIHEGVKEPATPPARYGSPAQCRRPHFLPSREPRPLPSPPSQAQPASQRLRVCRQPSNASPPNIPIPSTAPSANHAWSKG